MFGSCRILRIVRCSSWVLSEGRFFTVRGIIVLFVRYISTLVVVMEVGGVSWVYRLGISLLIGIFYFLSGLEFLFYIFWGD